MPAGPHLPLSSKSSASQLQHSYIMTPIAILLLFLFTAPSLEAAGNKHEKFHRHHTGNHTDGKSAESSPTPVRRGATPVRRGASAPACNGCQQCPTTPWVPPGCQQQQCPSCERLGGLVALSRRCLGLNSLLSVGSDSAVSFIYDVRINGLGCMP